METRKAIIENYIKDVWPQYWISETTGSNGPFHQTYVGMCNPTDMMVVKTQLEKQLQILFPPNPSDPQRRLTEIDVNMLRNTVPLLVY